jgi:hypothetical protein
VTQQTAWGIAEWITEAVDRYAESRELLQAWRRTGYMSDYQEAANATQAAAAAAAIATAKLGWDMTE